MRPRGTKTAGACDICEARNNPFHAPFSPFPLLPSLSYLARSSSRTPVQIVEDLCIGDPHPNFRLWLSSGPHPKFPISILRRGLKMTTEPPAGLRANVSTLYNIVSPVSEIEGGRRHDILELFYLFGSRQPLPAHNHDGTNALVDGSSGIRIPAKLIRKCFLFCFLVSRKMLSIEHEEANSTKAGELREW